MRERNGTATVKHSAIGSSCLPAREECLLGIDVLNGYLELLDTIRELRRERFIDLEGRGHDELLLTHNWGSSIHTSHTSMSSFDKPV